MQADNGNRKNKAAARLRFPFLRQFKQQNCSYRLRGRVALLRSFFSARRMHGHHALCHAEASGYLASLELDGHRPYDRCRSF
jgi:hypothetical protein